jgi:Ca2+-binding EF-hand superfamily protein
MTDRLSKDKILQYKMAFDLFDRDATNTLAIKVFILLHLGFRYSDEEFRIKSNGRRVRLNN